MPEYKISKETQDSIDFLTKKMVAADVARAVFYEEPLPSVGGKPLSQEAFEKMLLEENSKKNQTFMKGLVDSASKNGFVAIVDSASNRVDKVSITSQSDLDNVQQTLLKVQTRRVEGEATYFDICSDIVKACGDSIKNKKKFTDKEANDLLDQIPLALEGAKKAKLDPPSADFNLLSIEKAILEQKEKLNTSDRERLTIISEEREKIENYLEERSRRDEKGAPGQPKPPAPPRAGDDIRASLPRSQNEWRIASDDSTTLEPVSANIAVALLKYDLGGAQTSYNPLTAISFSKIHNQISDSVGR